MNHFFGNRHKIQLLAVASLFWGTSATAGFLLESPINITPSEVTHTALPSLSFNYSTNASLTVLNTGSPDVEKSIKATPTLANSTLNITGDINTYTLLQFHFHEPSEHLFNSMAEPMEMHMVFTKDGTNPDLVVGRLIELGAHNALLDPIFSQLSTGLLHPNDQITVNGFNLTQLLPNTFDSFRYDGSLTTTPYTTGIQWILLAQDLFMDQPQINAFETLFFNGNSRETQPLNGRVVLTDVASFIPEPSSLALMLIGFAAFGSFQRRKTL